MESDQYHTVDKVKINFESDLIIMLTNESKISFFKHRKFFKSIELKSNDKHKFLFINDSSDFKNINSTDKTFFLFDLINYDLVEMKLINGLKLDNIQIDKISLLDKSKLNKNCNINQFVIVLRELDSLLFMDKYLKNFSFISYKNRYSANDANEVSSIRYSNHQDEKLVENFFKSTSNFTQFKFKVLKVKNFEFYFQ